MSHPSLVWFRNDLRLDDQPALAKAIERGEPVIPVYLCSPDEEGRWKMGAASRWWLHQSLSSLTEQLESKGSRLIIREGDALAELERLIEETDASAVYWTRHYEPAAIKRDTEVKAALRKKGIDAESENGQLLFEPWEVQTKEGKPYQVFTAFWKSCLAREEPPEPVRMPRAWKSPHRWPSSLKLESLKLEPTIPWDEGMRQEWKPGTVGAQAELKRFLKSCGDAYKTNRDFPSLRGTSRLSPHLHFGEISPRTIWCETRRAMEGRSSEGLETFLKEVGWREFSYHLLYHFPKTPEEPLHQQFSKFPWLNDEHALHSWQRGQTGFPIVDAGMRELWATGWMHNRVRMIVASFLLKDLLIPWQEGAKWFWETLVDADLASNTLGWQWTAGCGADAAPYFRIFNPVLQSAKFDPEGEYIRRWVPELQKLPTKWLHSPWEASVGELARAGVQLGTTYPHPIVDHGEARDRALAALKTVSSK